MLTLVRPWKRAVYLSVVVIEETFILMNVACIVLCADYNINGMVQFHILTAICVKVSNHQ
jgi:hypothetical protein